MMIHIILTSALQIPQGSMKISNFNHRIHETKKSLTAWNKVKNCEIHCLDNTDANLTSFSKTFERVSFTHVPGGPYSNNALGEFTTIKSFFTDGKQLGENDIILKVNARYFVANINVILEDIYANPEVDCWCHLRSNLKFADTRVIAGSKNFWETFAELNFNFNNPKFYFEHAMATHVLRRVSNGHNWRNFFHSPVIVGTSGSTGKKYSWLTQNALRPLYYRVYNWAMR